MNPSPCAPAERLAAYFDAELPQDEARAVERHLRTCEACRRTLESMSLVRTGLRSVPVAPPPDAVWDGVESALAGRSPSADLERASYRRNSHLRSPSPRRVKRLRNFGRIAAAAFVLVALASIFALPKSTFLKDSLLDSQDNAPSHGESLPVVAASAPFDLGPFLLKLDRTDRLPSFSDGFRETPVSAREAIWNITAKVEFDWTALPSALLFERAYMIERSSYRMAQLVFSHPRGMVVLFIQPSGYTVSFADHPTEPAVVGGRPCLKVRCGDYQAYCFQTEAATFTVIGRSDDPMLERLYSVVSGRR